MMSKLFQATILLFFSLILSITVNQFHPRGLPLIITKDMMPGIPKKIFKSVHFIDVKQAYIEAKKGMLIDLRSASDFQNSHAKGAINWSYEMLEKNPTPFIKGVKKETPLYLYCYDETCPLSIMASKILWEQGFRQIFIIKGGFSAWEGNWLPEEKNGYLK